MSLQALEEDEREGMESPPGSPKKGNSLHITGRSGSGGSGAAAAGGARSRTGSAGGGAGGGINRVINGGGGNGSNDSADSGESGRGGIDFDGVETLNHHQFSPVPLHGSFGVPVTVTESSDDLDPTLAPDQAQDQAPVNSAEEEDDNYCLRALQCACELREHKDSNLGTHIAVTAGK